MRAYATSQGTAIFRLQEHTQRLFNSAKILGMKMPYSAEELNATQLEVLRRNELKNADESVRRLKGPTRPVNACTDRMRVLAALRCVDYVVAFDEDTPARLIGDILPDVLVKGGDYKPEQIAGADAVHAAGGEVVVLDFHAGYSTTAMIERAR